MRAKVRVLLYVSAICAAGACQALDDVVTSALGKANSIERKADEMLDSAMKKLVEENNLRNKEKAPDTEAGAPLNLFEGQGPVDLHLAPSYSQP